MIMNAIGFFYVLPDLFAIGVIWIRVSFEIDTFVVMKMNE